MKTLMTGRWQTLLMRGLVAIAFGVFAIANASATALILLTVFVLYAISDGALTLVMAIAHRADTPRWWLGALYGIVSILFGMAALVLPQVTALLMLYIIAARVIVGGFFEIGLALRLGDRVRGEWLLVVAGALSIFLGAWLVVQPKSGGLAVLWVIGLYALGVGALLVMQAVRVKLAG